MFKGLIKFHSFAIKALSKAFTAGAAAEDKKAELALQAARVAELTAIKFRAENLEAIEQAAAYRAKALAYSALR